MGGCAAVQKRKEDKISRGAAQEQSLGRVNESGITE